MEEIVGYELGPQQKLLWNEQQRRALGVHAGVIIDGPLEIARVQEAVDCVVARHEILRTSFAWLAGMETPLQVIEAPGSIRITELEAVPARLAELVEQTRTEEAEPLRVKVVRLGNERHALLLSLSPLCGDVWSMKNLIAELTQHLATGEMAVSGEELVQYTHFSEWQRELLESDREQDEKGHEYWRRQSENLPEPIVLPGEKKKAAASEDTACISVTLDAEVVTGARSLAESRSIDLATVLLAAWQVLLFRLTGAEQVLVLHGTPVRKYEEMESGLGQYMTWLPVNGQLSAKLTFKDVLSRLRDTLQAHAKHQEYFNPEALRGEEQKLPIGFSCEAWPILKPAGNLRFEVLSLYGSTMPLKLHLQTWEQAGALRLEFWYAQAHYSEAVVKRLAEQYQTLLSNVVVDVRRRLEQQSLVSAGERELVLKLGQGRSTTVFLATLHELFEQQVERTPDAAAVCFKEQCLSFQELNRSANQLAHHLRQSSCKPEDRIGIMMERGVEMIVAVFAVLKAGCAYVPLDPANPTQRLVAMLEDATPTLVLTQSHLQSRIPEWPSITIDGGAELGDYDDTNPDPELDPSNLAYVLYTSGSTGRPKGVAVQHASVVNLLHALNAEIYSSLPTGQHVAMNAPLSFDASVKQLFQIVQGHALYPVPEELRVSGPEMLDWLAAEQINVLDSTPSHLRLFLNAGLLTAQSRPGVVLVGGEAIDDELWQTLHQQSEIKFYNVYGPTECTVDTTVLAVDACSSPSLGSAINNVSVYLSDQSPDRTAPALPRSPARA